MSNSSGPRMPDLVLDSELLTTIHGNTTEHLMDMVGSVQGGRRVRRKQHWLRKSCLGRGAYGSVWLEECTQGSGDVQLRAVKQIHKEVTSSNKIAYHRELEVIMKFSNAKYSHCFVRSFGWYQCSQNVYIAMEYLPGGDLSTYMSKPFPESHACQIVSQVLEGLLYMHQSGFAHRDLKPGNILVVSKPPDDWWVKLSDFGISKREKSTVNSATVLRGTIGFLSPELLGFYSDPRSKPQDDKPVDIWALGETTVQLLTGKPTFEHLSSMFMYCSAPNSFPLHELRSHSVSDLACDFIEGAMKVSPECRMTSKGGLEHKWIRNLADLNVPPVAAQFGQSFTPERNSVAHGSIISDNSLAWSDIGNSGTIVQSVPSIQNASVPKPGDSFQPFTIINSRPQSPSIRTASYGQKTSPPPQPQSTLRDTPRPFSRLKAFFTRVNGKSHLTRHSNEVLAQPSDLQTRNGVIAPAELQGESQPPYLPIRDKPRDMPIQVPRKVVATSSYTSDQYPDHSSFEKPPTPAPSDLTKTMKALLDDSQKKNIDLKDSGSATEDYRPCRHKKKSLCQLEILSCCSCADKRPKMGNYEIYVDGEGYTTTNDRSRDYCPSCKEYWSEEAVQLRRMPTPKKNKKGQNIPAPQHAQMCEHKSQRACQLSPKSPCCACADMRPVASGYKAYVDGIGMVTTTVRWKDYCPGCKDWWGNELVNNQEY